jgi:anthranilate synthase/aminodeoxychorismate synthase-like glutamine amidotransferase
MIDNYDSFTYNLVHQLQMLGTPVDVVRNDAVTIEGAAEMTPAALVVSPGPGTPDDAGVSVPLIRRLAGSVPILGVCLGHQAIVAAFGGQIGPARSLVHGKASVITHDGESVYRGLPQDIEVGRYHSLAATSLPHDLVVTARTADGEVMGVRHRSLPIEGVQFHPESVLTPQGTDMIRNFVAQAGLVPA